MRGTKVRELTQLYRRLKQMPRPEGRELITFRALKKLYTKMTIKQKENMR